LFARMDHHALCGRAKRRIDFGRAVSRILSSRPGEPGQGENHLSEQPVPGTHSVETETEAGSFVVPYLALLPMGFSVPRRLLGGRWALTPPFHPYRCTYSLSGGFFFCGTIRRKAFQLFSRVYPGPHRPGLRGIAPCGVRTFLPRLAPEAILRPSKIVRSLMHTCEDDKFQRIRSLRSALLTHEFQCIFCLRLKDSMRKSTPIRNQNQIVSDREANGQVSMHEIQPQGAH